MIVYPAIDMRGGKVVRLVQGDPERQTVHSDSPYEVGQRWADCGAEWLHVVNLDGALGEATLNLDMLARLASLGLPIEFGGGLRSLTDARRALDAGASRVILGTMVVKEPDLAREAIEKFSAEAIAVALDARDGQVATHGWQTISEWSAVDLGMQFARMGVRHALYTDISRDGELQGVNVEATAELARRTGLAVIASGGVSSLDDIRALRAQNAGIAGVIIGKALYTGAIRLEDALVIAGEAAGEQANHAG
ncbi:MAG: 1-(5-phosphoribosyl)-5-[(5-phosphoribosylamino)methylideneamino]imidazole-4-carboxamide isomerase [Anaerolineae bacterium]|nr:1-(5-phosphoribosyl)-5-[(5-phosphoribosylamino)methylideneamino]imidazole-4-carboxamide isomerase [Anaerolineae bacterium]